MSTSDDEKILVLYFAILRDQAGAPRESVRLIPGDTPERVFKRLASHHSFQLSSQDLRMAVNDEFVAADLPLKSGDSLAFIPPVAGG